MKTGSTDTGRRKYIKQMLLLMSQYMFQNINFLNFYYKIVNESNGPTSAWASTKVKVLRF